MITLLQETRCACKRSILEGQSLRGQREWKVVAYVFLLSRPPIFHPYLETVACESSYAAITLRRLMVMIMVSHSSSTFSVIRGESMLRKRLCRNDIWFNRPMTIKSKSLAVVTLDPTIQTPSKFLFKAEGMYCNRNNKWRIFKILCSSTLPNLDPSTTILFKVHRHRVLTAIFLKHRQKFDSGLSLLADESQERLLFTPFFSRDASVEELSSSKKHA